MSFQPYRGVRLVEETTLKRCLPAEPEQQDLCALDAVRGGAVTIERWSVRQG